jgi:hypothetical protein
MAEYMEEPGSQCTVFFSLIYAKTTVHCSSDSSVAEYEGRS